jgi:hypothetical protein
MPHTHSTTPHDAFPTVEVPATPIAFGRAAPCIGVRDIRVAYDFSAGVLGFTKAFENADPVRFMVLKKDAAEIHHLWPEHHFYLIMLTVALLTQLPVEHLPAKTIQRLLGTIFGVGIAWVIATNMTSPPILAVLACIFATLVPIARARNYLLYSIVATPLILLVLDLGRPIDIALLSDRIIATMIGGSLVIAGNAVTNRLLHQGA